MLLAFLCLTGGAVLHRWRDRPARFQGLVIMAGLALMVPAHSDLWEFGVWIAAAYLADLVGRDAAVGACLALSALFYPLTALGFNQWWCQGLANAFGIAAVFFCAGFGRGILGDWRFRRGAGIDAVGRVWGGAAGKVACSSR